MAIHTHDPELSDAIDFLRNKFPKNDLHGECTENKFPEEYETVNCNGTNMIIWQNVMHKECLNYCRESTINRMMGVKL